MTNQGRFVRVLKILTLAVLVTIGCACSVKTLPKNTDIIAANALQTSATEPFKPVLDRARDAYLRGDLSRAESFYTSVLREQPAHEQAMYNLSVILLVRAYATLNRYMDLHAGQDQSLIAHRLLEQLEAMVE